MCETALPSPALGHLASVIGESCQGSNSAFLLLLKGPVPSKGMARLDAHFNLLRQLLCAIEEGWARLFALEPDSEAERFLKKERSGFMSACDFLVELLLAHYPQKLEEARALARALARLKEESPRLLSRRSLPLGKGFEGLFDERLKRRFERFPHASREPEILEQHLQTLLEEPSEAYALIERNFGRELDQRDRDWIECERKAGLLNFVRRDKTDGKGHIRWYLRKDSEHLFVLARLGVEGHWLVTDAQNQQFAARFATAYERVHGGGQTTPLEWNRLGDSALSVTSTEMELRKQIRCSREALSCQLQKSASGLIRAGEKTQQKLSRSACFLEYQKTTGEVKGRLGNEDTARWTLPAEASVDEWIEFCDQLEGLHEHRQIQVAEGVFEHAMGRELGALVDLFQARQQERQSGYRVRLVYVPSELPHQLGGVPEVGAQFLKDRLEKKNHRCLSVKVYRRDFERRLPEFLGADVIGIGVYIHNRGEVAEFCQLLRGAGYRGRIVLGGPETRSIEDVQEDIRDWDAIIRGEADDALLDALSVFEAYDRGDEIEALNKALDLGGMALRLGTSLLLCETATRNKSAELLCPLPFDWRKPGTSLLKMNFSRGCPYLCTFCPNHQGRAFRAGSSDELWRFSVLAVADQLGLTPAVEEKIAGAIASHLGVEGGVNLRVGLTLLLRSEVTATFFNTVFRSLAGDLAPPFRGAESASCLEEQLGYFWWKAFEASERRLSIREIRAAWLQLKLAFLGSRQYWLKCGGRSDILEAMEQVQRAPFTIETSEDNTLVNRVVIAEYLRRRRDFGLHRDFCFNPGQNTIRDLMTGRGGADEAFIALLVEDNPFAVAFGADGTSNAVLRQNRKPGYGVEALVAVNKALGKYDVEAANNYILLTPETTFLEAIESFVLWLLLPVPWRDYGASINLRVIKEETTLANDEGLIFAVDDEGWDSPFRDAELEALILRWNLSSMLSRQEFLGLLRRLLSEDDEVRGIFPRLLDRWRLNVDKDCEMGALAALLDLYLEKGIPLLDGIWRLRDRVQKEALIGGQTKQGLQDLFEATLKQLSPEAKTSV
jgi:hypothetical protein